MTANQEGKTKVAVVGAGIAGLATAYLLRETGRKVGREFDISIYEAADHHGGSTRTDHLDGYLCEWGPNGFLDNEPATFDLIKQLGIESDLVKADDNASRRFIYHGGALRQLPSSPPAFLFSDILPLPSRLRVIMELLIPRKSDNSDETVDSFGRRRLGKGFARYLLDPMVSGIFAGDTTKLSLEAVFPKMTEMEREYGGLFKAMIAKGRAARKQGTKAGGPAGPNAVLHTFKQGMGFLTDRLASELSGVLHLNRPVTGIRRQGDRFLLDTTDESIEADSIVLACPSHAAAAIIRDISQVTSVSIGDIYHAPVNVVCHGHRVDHFSHPLRGFGVLVPRSEGIRSLGTLWSNSIFPGQAPSGYNLLRTLVGGAHDPEVTNLSDEDLHNLAHQDHEQIMDVRGEPDFRTQYRHPRGIAQYNVGHLNRVAASEKLESELPGLFFTGASYRGVSVNGCIKDAFRVVSSFCDQNDISL